MKPRLTSWLETVLGWAGLVRRPHVGAILGLPRTLVKGGSVQQLGHDALVLHVWPLGHEALALHVRLLGHDVPAVHARLPWHDRCYRTSPPRTAARARHGDTTALSGTSSGTWHPPPSLHLPLPGNWPRTPTSRPPQRRALRRRALHQRPLQRRHTLRRARRGERRGDSLRDGRRSGVMPHFSAARGTSGH